MTTVAPERNSPDAESRTVPDTSLTGAAWLGPLCAFFSVILTFAVAAGFSTETVPVSLTDWPGWRLLCPGGDTVNERFVESPELRSPTVHTSRLPAPGPQPS